MEIWLNMGSTKFRLPVIPPEFALQNNNSNERVKINAIGTINLLGKKDLKEISFDTFFPAQRYSFVQYTNFPPPWDCVKMIEQWKNSGKPFRLVMTGTSINMEVAVDTFEYGLKDGTKDVYYSIGLSQYVRIKDTKNNNNKSKGKDKRPSVEKDTSKKTYIVKAGDTLGTIAKRETGKTSNLSKIAKQNGIKNPNKIKAGQKLIL